MRFTVLWTKQVRKKVKTYHDGFVTINGSRHAKLLDADGVQVLCSTTLPRSQQLAPDIDGIDCFEGFLVNCLEDCSQNDSGVTQWHPAAAPAEKLPEMQARHSGSKVAQAAARPALLLKRKSRHDVGFTAPRPAAVPAPTEHADALQAQVAPCMQQSRQRMQHPALVLQQPQRQHLPHCSIKQATDTTKRQRRRSDDDILQALGLPPPSTQQVSSKPLAAPTAAAVFAAPAEPQTVGWQPAMGTPSQQAASGAVCPSDAAAMSPEQCPLLSRPALAPIAPCSLGSIEWSDEEEPGQQAAGEPAAGVNVQAAETWSLGPPLSSVLTDRHNSQAGHKPPRPPDLPPPGRKAAVSVRTQQGPAFAAPRMQAPRPAAHPEAGSASGSAAAGASSMPSAAAARRLHRAEAALPISQPGAVEFATPWQERRRGVAVPDTFQSLQDYKRIWSAALNEEAGLRFAETAARFHQALQRISPAAQAGRVSRPPQELQSSLRRSGLQYYAEARLVMYKESSGGKFGGSKARTQDAGSGSAKKHTFYLELLSGRERSAAYRKGDLWAISSNAQLAGAGSPGSTSFTVVAESCWHGPNADGRMEVQLLGPRPPGLTRSQPVYALHGPNAATELGAAALLQAVQPGHMPLLTPLLASKPRAAQQPASAVPGIASSTSAQAALSVAVRAAAERHRLNPEQAAVLAQVEAWSSPAASKENTGIVLVHGPFGSGKTTLLVALILFLRSLTPSGPNRNRVLVAAHTNAAVDRILLGLAAHGFTDFLRVGSLPRIHKDVLQYSLHMASADARAKKGGAAAELKTMLANASSPAEASIIRKELAAVEAGAEAKRRRSLKTAGVVGSTCCAALAAEALQGVCFDVVVLDEAAQVVEPLALAPILRSGCRLLVAAGDPCQLPPLVATPQALSQGSSRGGGSSAAGGSSGLGRSLFERLVAAGLPAHLLRRQYRCHPDIAAVPNRCFYGGQLLDGISAADRAPLLAGCPPLAVLDVRGSEVYDASRSASNPAEAQAVRRLVRQLVEHGVPRSDIGVICFFHAQVRCIQATLGDLISSSAPGEGGEDAAEPELAVHQEVQVATVDSFQGMERAVIILSTAVTRTGAFASDARRLNVALTRARRHLFIVGAAPTLHQSAPALQQVVSRCRAATNAFWPDGRLLLPPPVAAAAVAAAISSSPMAVDTSSERPSDCPSGRGNALQLRSSAAAAQHSAPGIAPDATTAVYSSRSADDEEEQQPAVAALHGGAAVADGDPDVPCFDLGI